jgi:hypothetical protein
MPINAFKAAEPYLNQIAPMSREKLNPYINRGNEAGNLVHGQYQNLIENPYGQYEDIFNNYKPSSGFQLQLDQALKAMRNSAAAGGYSGTEADQFRQGDLASQLAGQDFQNYFNNIMGLYNTGLEGEQGFSNEGYNANESLTGIEGQTLGAQSGLAFQNAQQKNQNKNDLAKALFQALGTIGGAAAGSAFGPAGTAAGASLGGKTASSIW